jgi:hypothetical protein
MACSILRNKDGVIETVLAPNQKVSKLYLDALSVVKDKEKALRLWALGYTDSFKDWMSNLKPEKSEQKIKPEAEELFEANPELANQVYEALGFNNNNFELKENKEAFGKEPHPEGATSYDIFSNGRKIGKIALFEGKNPMIKGLNLNESERNKGLGKALYKWLNYKATLKGGRLYADQEFISPDAQRVWESLNKEGLVDLMGNSPKFNDKQKQQALQLYSQYLEKNPNGNIEGFKNFVNEKENKTENYSSFIDENKEPTFEAVSMYLLNSREEVKPGVIEKEGGVSFTTDNPLFNKCAK